jgi:Family of unknown function (DUF6153)
MSPAPTTAGGTRRTLRMPATSRASGPTALAALVAALVVGILGMHALTTHGTTAAPVAATSSTVATHATSMVPSASHDARANAAEHTSGTAAGVVDADSGSGHDAGSMAMLCVVMLAGAALTLLVLLVVSVRRPLLLPASFAPAVVRARVLEWVGGTGPPPVWRFSVIRC